MENNELLDSLSEMVRTVDRAMNTDNGFVPRVDKPRLQRAKNLLIKYSFKNISKTDPDKPKRTSTNG